MKKKRKNYLSKTVICIDPGLAKIGYSIFKNEEYVSHGVITTNADQLLHHRINYLADTIESIVLKNKCQFMVIEEFFAFKKNKNGIHTSKVIGSFLKIAGKYDLGFSTYSPRTLKTKIGGTEAMARKRKGETTSIKTKRQKMAVLEGVLDRLGFNPGLSYSNNHAVDSVALYFLFKNFQEPIDTTIDRDLFLC